MLFQQEEEERSEKWKNFLERCLESTKPHNLIEESGKASESETTTQESKVDLESPKSGDDSSTVASNSGIQTVSLVKRKKLQRVQTWVPIRALLIPIETLMNVHIKNKVSIKNKHASVVQKQLRPVDLDVCPRENFKEDLKEHLLTREVISNENYVDITTIEDSSESRYISNDFYKAKDSSFIPNHETNTPITNSTPQDETMNMEESNMKEGLDIGSTMTSEDPFPWEEELESLVHGGVPKSLRGEVRLCLLITKL